MQSHERGSQYDFWQDVDRIIYITVYKQKWQEMILLGLTEIILKNLTNKPSCENTSTINILSDKGVQDQKEYGPPCAYVFIKTLNMVTSLKKGLQRNVLIF